MATRTEDRLGSYILGSRLGKGGMGVVYSATSPHIPKPVAVKVLREELSSEDEAVSRFLREKRIFNSVEHPNVVKLHDLVIQGDRLGLVMELIEGGDLKALISSGTLDVPGSVELARQIAAGLAHIHVMGIAHCDLKPANVLISNDGSRRTAKITDFGVSSLLDEASTRLSTTIGTPLYMAPEVTTLHRTGSASDVYALGAMLFEMLVGKPPFFGGGTMAVVVAHSRYPAPELTGLPAELCELVADMLSKDPAERPSAIEVGSRLEAIAALVDKQMEPTAATPLASRGLPTSPERPESGSRPATQSDPKSQSSIFGPAELRSVRSEAPVPDSTSSGDIDDPATTGTVVGARVRPWTTLQESSGPVPISTQLADFATRYRAGLVAAAAALLLLIGVVAAMTRGSSDLLSADGVLSQDDAPSAMADQDASADLLGPTVLASPGGPDEVPGSTARFSDQTTTTSAAEATSLTTSESTQRSTTSAANQAGASSSTTATTVAVTIPPTSLALTTQPPALPSTVPVTHTIRTTTTIATTTTPPTTRVTVQPTPPTIPTTTPTAPSSILATTAPTTSSTTPPTTATPTTATPITAPPTTVPPTTAPPTTASPADPVEISIVSGPQLVSVSPTSAVFTYTTNDVCGSGSFVYRNQATGQVVGRWIGDDGCFGPTHFGTTAWPGIVLEPGTTYDVSISVIGKPSDGVLPTGTGRDTSSIVITTPAQA